MILLQVDLNGDGKIETTTVEDGINFEIRQENLLAAKNVICKYEDCSVKIQDFSLHNILLRIKHIGTTKECLLFEIPEENPIFKNLDLFWNYN